MSYYEINKEQLPDLDKFENAKNSILRDMYQKSLTRKLTYKQINFAAKLWNQEINGNPTYDINKKKLSMLDDFENARNSILRDMHRNAQRYQLTDKQIVFALKLWDSEGKPPVHLDDEMIAALRLIGQEYMPNNYYTSAGYSAADMAEPVMEREKYDRMIAKFYKYRKSILKKLFK